MAEDGDDLGWKMEAVMMFMKSPEYTVPVMDFIDENCITFDEEEVGLHARSCATAAPLCVHLLMLQGPQESKLEFSNTHEKFVEMVFGLLEAFLAEIGVTQEE